ncbi:MAG: hypothetical protein QOH14_759 [Pseudonocardiales bacterium]|nr:hypothetical protein [Pseudonocardiales bacterium]
MPLISASAASEPADTATPPRDVGSASVWRRHALALAEECRLLNEAQRMARIGSWQYELATAGLEMSPAMRHMHGLEASGVDDAASLRRRLHPEDREALDAAAARLIREGGQLSLRYRVLDAVSGEHTWMDARGAAVLTDTGTVVRLVGTVADVTEHVRGEIALRQAHTELTNAQSYEQAVITACPDAIHIHDVATESISRANRLTPDLIGYTPETIDVMSGWQLQALLPAEDLLRFQAALVTAQSAADGEVIKLRHRILHADATLRWLSRRMTPFQRDEHGKVTQVLIVSRDVTHGVQMEERLEHAALHDDLTGLPNRRLVVNRLRDALTRTDRRGQIALLFCDLDGFKRVNDSHGHSTGDGVLIATSDRLRHATRTGDTVGRMGGDEFVVIVDVPADEDPRTLAEKVARRIEQAVALPMVVHGEEHSVTVSIGIALAKDGTTPQGMLSDADTAMYHAKTSGANGHTVFDQTLRQEPLGRDHTERAIRRALERDTIEAHYRPIVDPADESIVGVEALLRVPDADGQYLGSRQGHLRR